MLRTLALLALAVPSAHAGVLHVGPGAPSPAYPTINAAIAAAVDGDVIQLTPNLIETVDPIVIDGKSLSLVGAGGELRLADGVLASVLTVRNLAADQAVYVSGFGVSGSQWPSPVVLLEDNAGRVNLHGVNVFSSHATGIRVDACDDAVIGPLFALVINEFAAVQTFSEPAHGVQVLGDSRVLLDGVTVVAHEGAHLPGAKPYPVDAGSAVHVTDSIVELRPFALQGGRATSSLVDGCTWVGSNGAAVEVVATGAGPAPHVELLADPTTLKAGGVLPAGACGPAPTHKLALHGPPGSITPVLTSPRSIGVPGYVDAGTASSYRVSGLPGDGYLVVASASLASPAVVPGYFGTVVLDLNTQVWLQVGSLSAPFIDVPIPAFTPSALPLRVHGQALHFGSGGPPTISAPFELHWL